MFRSKLETLRSLARLTLFAVVIVAVAGVWGYLSRGSVWAIAALARGDVVVISLSLKCERESASAVVFVGELTVTNVLTEPVRLTGTVHTCSCVTVEGLPTEVGPGQSRRLPMTVHAVPRKPLSVQGTLLLGGQKPPHIYQINLSARG